MSRNASARSLLQGKISNSKGAFNPHTGKLQEDEEEYIPKKQTVKKAEKSASSLRSQGQAAEVVRDTGLRKSLATLRDKTKAPTVKINTDKGFIAKNATVNPSVGWKAADMTKSTAKDEKTRLYETNDSFLNPQEIIKKYSYVAQDKDMDYSTLRRAVNKGMTEVGRTLRQLEATKTGGFAAQDMKQFQEAAKLQTALQGRLKSASFTAGLLDSMGGDIKDIATKASNNQALQKQNAALKEQMEQTKANNSGAAMVGTMTGEMAKAGAGYMTIGKAAEEAALKGAGKLGQKMTAATASDAAQKMAAKVLLDPKKAKAAQFAARMLGQQAADTAVNTPFTIAAGLAQGKSKDEITKDIGKQIAMDAAFNMGMEGIGAVAKVTGKALKSASRKGPIAGIDFEKIGYENAVPDEGLIAFKKGVDDGTIGKWQYYDLESPTKRAVKDITEKTGVDISGFGTSIKPEELIHIENRHGIHGEADSSMADVRDLGKIQYVLDNYDNVNLTGEVSYAYKNSDGSPAKMIIFDKRINGTYYIVEAVPDSKRKKLQIISAYKSKKREGYQVPDANMPPANGRTALEIPSTKNISQGNADVKTIKKPEVLTRRSLLPEEKIPESIRQEYRDLNNADYISARLKEINERYGGDSQKLAEENTKLNSRREELEEILGIRTKKVQDTERRIQTEAIKEIKNLLSLSGKQNTEDVQNLLRQAMIEGRTGAISKETRDRIFNGLFDLGRISNRADVDQELKQRLKTLSLRISAQDAANIPDFNQWRKGTFGKIGSVGVDHKGNIDTEWMELNARWPHLFPDDITNPADQLTHIKAVADEMAYREIPLAETADEGAKAGMREEFDATLDRLETEMQKLTAFTNDRAERQARKLMLEGESMDYNVLSTDDMKSIYDQQYQLKQAAEKIRSKKNLTEGDKLALQKLLRGEIDEETARKYAGLNADDLMEVYAAEKPLYNINKSIQSYKEQANSRFRDEISSVMGDIPIRSAGKKGWRDLGPLRMARETQERILDMIAPTKEQAKQLKETLFDPIHTSERDRTLFKNDLIDRVKETGISTKNNISVKMPNGQTVKTSESALVQWLGENRYQLRQMERKKGWATAEDIAKEQDLRRQIEHIESSIGKEQLKKIDSAIEEMQEIYKEIHPKINEVLIRNGYDPVGYIDGYFPHMSFDDPNNIIEKAAQKLGFDFSSKELPMDISGRTETFRPGKKWAGNLLTREGKETDYDALRAFDLYIDNISDVIYHTDNIKRLRSYEDYMRYTLSDDGIKEKVDAIKNSVDLTEAEKAKRIDEVYEGVQNHSLQNYVNNIRTYTDLLAGKKHKVDRVLETELFGRKVYKVVSEIENRVAGNMVAGNIGSALTNFIPITQGMSSMSTASNLRGLGEALVYMSKGEMDELTRKSAFLATREGGDMLYKTTMRRISDVAGKPMEWADKFSTQAVWRSRYYDNVAKGMGEEAAIKNADEFARGLFAGRSKGAMPTAFSAKALKPLTMFQLEVNNQISYLLKDIPKEAQGSVRKMMKAYGGIIIGAYIYNDVYEKLTGRRSALDPFSMANEAFGDLTGTQVRNTLDIIGDAVAGDDLRLTENVEQQKPSQALAGLTEEIGGNVPFVGGLLFDGGRIPLQSAMPSMSNVIGAIGNIASGDDTAEKGLQTIGRELIKPATYLVPPVAGGQIKKTAQGLKTMAQGGSYTQTNEGSELQFPVDQESKRQWAQAGLFGKWATQGGQAHLEKDRSLGAKQTETYEKLISAGVKNTLAFETINRVQKETKAEEQRRTIRGSLLNDEQKAILYYDLVASDTDKEVLDYFKGKNSMVAAADCLSRIADYKGTSPKRNALRDSNLSDENKEYIYLHKIIDTDSSREKEKTKISALRQYGVDMDDYLKIKNKFSQVDDSGTKTKEKAAQMSQWLIDEGFTRQQQEAIKEQFAFWGMYKQKYK